MPRAVLMRQRDEVMFMTRQTAGPAADVSQGGDIGDDTLQRRPDILEDGTIGFAACTVEHTARQKSHT